MDNKIIYAVAIAIVAVSVVYWLLFSFNAYNTYHEYWDVGLYAYDMYSHLSIPQAVYGLQYLAFGNHLAPDQLLMLPFFAIDPSVLTLLAIQALVLSATGFLLFYVVKDLLKSYKIAFLILIAYLINPGLHGLLVFDYHAEFLMIPFYILTFYFFMKNSRFFYPVLILFLATIDVAPLLSIALGLGLLYYEMGRDNDTDRKIVEEKRKKALATIILSIIALVFYSATSSALLSSYGTVYQQLPESLRVIPFASQQLQLLTSINYYYISLSSAFSSWYGIYALVVVLLSFGVACLFEPVTTLLLVSPWIVEGFLIGYSPFLLIYYQYFSYAIGGSILATIIAIGRLKQNGNDLKRKLFVYSIAIYSVAIFVISPMFLISRNVNNLDQDLLFQISSTNAAYISQLNHIVSLVPANATVMTQVFIGSHLLPRQKIELLSDTTWWFKPQYVVVDFNENVSQGSINDY